MHPMFGMDRLGVILGNWGLNYKCVKAILWILLDGKYKGSKSFIGGKAKQSICHIYEADGAI